MKTRVLSFLLGAVLFAPTSAVASTYGNVSKEQIGTLLNNYVALCRAKAVAYPSQPYVESYSIDDTQRKLKLVVSSSFATQEFTE